MAVHFRLRLRNWFSNALELVPLSWLLAARNGYLSSRQCPVTHRLLHGLLALIRYRRLDPHISDFAIPETSLRLVNDGSLISRRVFWYGVDGYESSEVRWWRYFCCNATRILEIGANIGYFTIHGSSAARNTPYTAVEANPDAANSLRENLRINGLSHVTICEAAAVARKQKARAKLVLPQIDTYHAPAGAHLARDGEQTPEGDRYVDVSTVEASQLFPNVSLLKLDIEGSEYEVLSALRHDLEATRPVIFVEVLENTRTLRTLLSGLTVSARYDAFAIGAEQLHPLSRLQIADSRIYHTYKTRDIVLIPTPWQGPTHLKDISGYEDSCCS